MKKIKGDEDRRRRLGDQCSEIGNAILFLDDRLAAELPIWLIVRTAA